MQLSIAARRPSLEADEAEAAAFGRLGRFGSTEPGTGFHSLLAWWCCLFCRLVPTKSDILKLRLNLAKLR
jgi:hypothetical protein